MQGGEAGTLGEVRIDGAPVELSPSNVVLKKGQRILLRTPGGGGVGAPQERDKMAIDWDRLQGYTLTD